MKKFMQKRLKNEKGMTLIELLAVIVILAIIAAIAIPAIGNIIENSRYNALKSDALNILSSASIYAAESDITGEITAEALKPYLESEGKFEGNEYTVNRNEDGNLALTATAVETGNGEQKVNFEDATVKVINEDDQKGSDAEINDIKPAGSGG